MMDDRDIDRILGDEPIIAPSTGFAAQVMRQVRDEAVRLDAAPLEFPWHRFLPGFLTAVGLSLGTFMAAGWAAEADMDPGLSVAVLDALRSPAAAGVMIAAAATAGALLLAWAVGRPSGRRPLGL